ncbi:MAG: hypothetical protein ACYC5N_04925 [Endomicrobiales bacterium]
MENKLKLAGFVKAAAFFCMFCVAGGSLSAADIIAAPVPWVPEDNKVRTGNLADGIRFINLPPEGDIVIYAVTGDAVKHIAFKDDGTPVRWLGKNDNEEMVASGVYLWVVKAGDFVKTGKLMIIR